MSSSPRFSAYLGLVLIVGLILVGGLSDPVLAAEEPVRSAGDLTLKEFLDRVLARNEALQQTVLEYEATRRKSLAEGGIFEPEAFVSVSQEGNKRENTAEQQRSQFATTFWEENMVYQGGLEALVPTGARVRLAHTMRDLRNSLQDPGTVFSGATNGEYQAFIGMTVTQPLLKNAGPAANLASIRLAALASDLAFQEYRRQLMLIVSTAEAGYWNLYLAQEQVRFFQDSVSTAEAILRDARARLEAGKSSELEVQEAQSGLALRRSKLQEAEQKRYETAVQLITLYAGSAEGVRGQPRAVDQPLVREADPELSDLLRDAYEWNPDSLIQRTKAKQEGVRLGLAKNQRLPELNVKGAWGLNGLGDTPGASWDDIFGNDFPSWSVGGELRLPLGGGRKTKHELGAARLRQQQAEVALLSVERQIANSLDSSVHKLRSARESSVGYQSLIEFNQQLLTSALARLEVGRLESRRVLEVEADLFESRNSLVNALVLYERARLEVELVSGALLRRRNIEIDRERLTDATRQFFRHSTMSDVEYERVLKASWPYEDPYRNVLPRIAAPAPAAP